MSDGIKIEYTEGIVTAKLEIRSNSPNGSFEQSLIKHFCQLCDQIFNERAEVLMATKGNSEV